MKKRFALSLGILCCLLCGAAWCALLLGAQRLSLHDIVHEAQSVSSLIFFQIRLPRVVLVMLAGMLLAGSGAAFQLFFRNPLAEPGIMGISSGATLGAVVASCFGTGRVLGGILSPVNFGAFLGALGAGLLVTFLSGRRTGPAATTALLLCGTALGALYSAFTSIILAINDRQLHTMYIWMLGSFSGRGWNEVVFILLPAVGAFVLLLLCGRQLDLLAGGEVTALALGVQVARLRLAVIVAGALAASAAVCAGGTIGFVGLIAPHVMRRVFGAKGRTLIPLAMVGGAVLLLVADTVSRVAIPPSEIPVGTITALLGAPFFISLVFSRRGLRNG